MKQRIQGIIIGVLITALILISTITVFAEPIYKAVEIFYNDIKINLNGEQITPRDANGNVVEPFIMDGSTYLPVRAIAGALGLEVGWNGETNTVLLGNAPATQTPETPTPALMPDITLTGSFTHNSQVEKYDYTAPATGIYSFELKSDVTLNMNYVVRVYDSRGNQLNATDRYSEITLDKNGGAFELTAGQEYTIHVEQRQGFMDYSVVVRPPNIMPINRNEMSGEFIHSYQVYKYSLVAQIAGIYSFELKSDITLNMNYVVRVYDSRGNLINPTDGHWTREITLDRNGGAFILEANQTYTIHVEQRQGFMDYTVIVRPPNITPINGNQMSGEFVHSYQVYKYSLVANTTGIYSFELISDVTLNMNYVVRVYDSRGNQLNATDRYSEITLDKNGGAFELTAGQEYTIHVEQRQGFMEYTVNIRPPN